MTPCQARPALTTTRAVSRRYSSWRSSSGGNASMMVTDTAFMRNPHYHGSSDSAETLDYGRFAEVTRGHVSAVKRLGGIDAVADARARPPRNL
jgi:hypothetical protein